MINLIVAFRNFGKAPETKSKHFGCSWIWLYSYLLFEILIPHSLVASKRVPDDHAASFHTMKKETVCYSEVWYFSIELHGVIVQDTGICIFAALKTPKPPNQNKVRGGDDDDDYYYYYYDYSCLRTCICLTQCGCRKGRGFAFRR
jgi:hypothetical protein